MVFFAQLLILEYIAIDHHHNLISSLLYYPWLLHKISSQSVHNFLNNVIHKQISIQTNLRYWKYNLLCGFGFCCLMTPCLSKDIRCQIFPTCVSSKWCIFTFICATCSFLPLSFRCACPSGDESSPNLCNSYLITLLIDSSLFQFSVWLVLSGVDVAAGRSPRWKLKSERDQKQDTMILNIIQNCSGITHGRVLNGEHYTQRF